MPDKSSIEMLLVTWNYPPKLGGMEQLMFQLVQSIHPMIETTVIAPYSEKGFINDRKDKAKMYRPRRRGLFPFFCYALKEGRKLIKNEKFDLIMGGSALVSPIVYILSTMQSLPGMLYVHGLDLIYPNPIYQLGIKLLLPRINRIFTNSSNTASIAGKKCEDMNRVVILNPGIYSDDYQIDEPPMTLRKKFGFLEKIILLYVGRLARRKGVLEFVKYSLPEIVKNRSDVLFCVIGDDPKRSLSHHENIYQNIIRTADKLGIGEHLLMLGWVKRETLLQMYAVCDIFVLPAVEVQGDLEGFGIVLAEANAAGKPVVSSRLGGIPDAVEDGTTAVLVESEDWKAYTNAILQLINDESMRKRLGNAGRKRVKNNLDWRIVSDRFVSSIRGYLKSLDENR